MIKNIFVIGRDINNGKVVSAAPALRYTGYSRAFLREVRNILLDEINCVNKELEKLDANEICFISISLASRLKLVDIDKPLEDKKDPLLNTWQSCLKSLENKGEE